MKQESLLWKSVKKGLTRFFLTRIESSTINGIPDINACMDGNEFWLELKSKESKNLGLSNYQINWHIKHQKCGGQVFILAIGCEIPIELPSQKRFER